MTENNQPCGSEVQHQEPVEIARAMQLLEQFEVIVTRKQLPKFLHLKRAIHMELWGLYQRADGAEWMSSYARRLVLKALGDATDAINKLDPDRSIPEDQMLVGVPFEDDGLLDIHGEASQQNSN